MFQMGKCHVTSTAAMCLLCRCRSFALVCRNMWHSWEVLKVELKCFPSGTGLQVLDKS